MRAFISINLPETVQQTLADYAASWKKTVPHVRWVHPQSMHITLKFLGEIEEGNIGEISSRLHEIARQLSPFHICISGQGAFPSKRRPKIFWLGIQEGEETLKELAAMAEEQMKDLGFAPESRPFKSHITCGRVKGLLSGRERDAFFAEPVDPILFIAERIYLMKSILSPVGAKYSIVSQHSLAGPIVEP